MQKLIYPFLPAAALLALLAACNSPTVETESAGAPAEIAVYDEPYRPQFHFSPPENWINDPNGLVYLDGEYHLFYQYNPFGDTWGHMSWGHAVSRDLVHWEHLPVAIPEEKNSYDADTTMIFSGSAVIDSNNTSGLCPDGTAGCMVAIYSSHVINRPERDPVVQHQSIAWSTDRGRTFTKYGKNPVLDIGSVNFRDPKVFWYAPQNKWVMTVAKPDQYRVHFYESQNLKDWTFLSDFGPAGDTMRIWECPDLSEVRIEGEDNTAWVLMLSTGNPQPGAYGGMSYFVGRFDGRNFTPTEDATEPLYVDYGKDFFAGVTYNNTPDDRRLMMGWLNQWEKYAQVIPTSPWRSSMSFPRELSLRRTTDGLRLVQRPVEELQRLRGRNLNRSDFQVEEGELVLEGIAGRSLEIILELEPSEAETCGLEVLKSGEEATVIRYLPGERELQLDRTRSGRTDFHPTFPSVETAPVRADDGILRLHVFVDRSVVEVFADNGETVLTERVFPTGTEGRIALFSEGGPLKVRRMEVWEMNSVWSSQASLGSQE